MKGNVHVVGLGVISAIGNSVNESIQSFRSRKSGIGSITILDTLHKQRLPAGEVKLSNSELAERVASPLLSRTAMLGIHAAREAVQDSGIKNIKKFRAGVISATTVGGMDRTEHFFQGFIPDFSAGDLNDVVDHECGRSTVRIAEALGVKGFLSTINTACSSSVNSIIYAARLIQHGFLDVAIAGGTDSLTRFTLNGFNSLMILDSQPCRPFDASRNGLNLGEGAGFVVLASEKVLKTEDLKSYGVVSGYANTNDAFHQTASSPEGRGSFAAMQQSIQKAGLSTDDIDYINLHGTGTVNNDQSEGTAIRRLFGEKIPPLSSTKSFTGHTLGACGGLEAVFSLIAMKENVLLPSLGFTKPMPEVGITPVTEFRTAALNNVMSNSFGFGGNCSSIIFSRARI